MKIAFVIIMVLASFILGCVFTYIFFGLSLNKKERQMENTRKNLDMVNQWLILKQSGIILSKEINKYGIKKVAIYGMGICGRHLVRELLNSELEIAYAMDRKNMTPYKGVEIRKLRDNMPEVDAVINTVVHDKESINGILETHFNCYIINLEDIVFESYEKSEGNE